MSYRIDHPSSFRKSKDIPLDHFLDDKPMPEIRSLFLELLNSGIHGFCFSLYEEGQKPGDIISAAQIEHRMKIIEPYTGWIRSFSCIEGNEFIPQIAKKYNKQTLVGAWLGTDAEKNEQEIENLISLAKQGFVDVAAVGNEVLYRKDLTEDELINYIKRVKQAIPEVPVGYVDAYYEFSKRPKLAEICDVILCNCYPFWEGTPFRFSLQHMRQMFQQAKQASKGKRVIITETGWPSQGKSLGEAGPSAINAMKYFINTQLWSMDESVEIFYFASFDESWKVGAEGDVGAFWGIWDSNGNLKFINEPV